MSEAGQDTQRAKFLRVMGDRHPGLAVQDARDRIVEWAASRRCYCDEVFAPGRTVMCVPCKARAVLELKP